MSVRKDFEHPEFLVDTNWLLDHLGDPDIRVVDCDLPQQYHRAHIPNSTFMDDHYQKDPSNDRIHIMKPTLFSEMARSIGVGDDTLVIGYDNSMGLYAARLWWALNYYGHSNVKVLDGGWRKWLVEGKPITDKPTILNNDLDFSPQINTSMIVTAEQIKSTYRSPDVVVWDVRSLGEYTGYVSRGNQRTGHIPNAVHLEWLELVDQQTHQLKPPTDLRQILAANGITPDKRIEAH